MQEEEVEEEVEVEDKEGGGEGGRGGKGQVEEEEKVEEKKRGDRQIHRRPDRYQRHLGWIRYTGSLPPTHPHSQWSHTSYTLSRPHPRMKE